MPLGVWLRSCKTTKIAHFIDILKLSALSQLSKSVSIISEIFTSFLYFVTFDFVTLRRFHKVKGCYKNYIIL